MLIILLSVLLGLSLVFNLIQVLTADEARFNFKRHIRSAYFEGFCDAKEAAIQTLESALEETQELNSHEHWDQSFWYQQLNPNQ